MLILLKDGQAVAHERSGVLELLMGSRIICTERAITQSEAKVRLRRGAPHDMDTCNMRTWSMRT
jgi:hypothetical protein